MKNPRNAGVKPKYKEGVLTKVIHPLIPIEAEKDVLEAIDNVVKKYKS